MSKAQSAAGKSTKPAIPPAAPKGAGKKGGKNVPEGTHQVAAGAISGPTGKNMPEVNKPADVEITKEQREGERRQAASTAIAQFAASSMQAPAAHVPELTPEQKKAQEFAVELAKLSEKFGMPVPVAAVKQTKSANKQQRNGITRPAAGTVTGNIWDVADGISVSQNGAPAQIAQVKQHASLKDVNDHTIKTQYSRWRQFHGIKGRLQVVQAQSPEGNDDGIAAAMAGGKK